MKTVSYRTYLRALEKFRRELDTGRRIEVYDMNVGFDEPIQLGINWAAIGTVSIAEAREFAQNIMNVATAVENFKYNGYIVTCEDD
ncbi:MAG: hypothetical protein IJQ81_03410 [Oscillibacter sp.]|nr:hypothetical protein [Oscillibacter sp.]